STLPNGGMRRSSTMELTIFPNAAPMMTPTARSTALPFTANSLNSFHIESSSSYGDDVDKLVRHDHDLQDLFAGEQFLHLRQPLCGRLQFLFICPKRCAEPIAHFAVYLHDDLDLVFHEQPFVILRPRLMGQFSGGDGE